MCNNSYMLPTKLRPHPRVWTASLIPTFRLKPENFLLSLKHLPHPLSPLRPPIYTTSHLVPFAGRARESPAASPSLFLDDQANLTLKAQAQDQTRHRSPRLNSRLLDSHIRSRWESPSSANHIDLTLQPTMPPTHDSQDLVDLTSHDDEISVEIDIDSVPTSGNSPTSETRSTHSAVIAATSEVPTARSHPQSSGSNTTNAICLIDDDDECSPPPSPASAGRGLTLNRTTPRKPRTGGERSAPHISGTGETIWTRSSLIGAVKDRIARKANAVNTIEEAKQICFDEIMYLQGGQPSELGMKWAGGERQKKQHDQMEDNTTRSTNGADGVTSMAIPIRRSARVSPEPSSSVTFPATIDLTETVSDLDSDEGEELRRAIALSLEMQDHPTSAPDSPSDHEKSASIPQGSRDTVRNSVHEIATMPSVHVERDGSDTGGPSTSVTTFNLQALNRHQMEQERQARLKRKREEQKQGGSSVDSLWQNTSSRNGQDMSRTASPASVSPPPVRRRLKADVAATKSTSIGANPSVLNHSHESRRDSFYPTGRVLQTYIAGFPSTNTISFSQLIGPKDSLTSCLLSSFIWDFDWLLPHFATTRTKFQLVMHAKLPAQRDALRQDFQGVPNVRLCFPPMDGLINCMHSKLMLLFYDADNMDGPKATGPCGGTSWAGPRCRLVVPTANLTSADWGVGGVMENTVFVLDLPMRRDCQRGDVKDGDNTAARPKPLVGGHDQTAFGRSLISFLRAQTVPDDVIDKLGRFDFSSTEQLGFVHTVGGTHTGRQWRDTGVCGLGRTVKELGLGTDQEIQVDFVASSMGSLNPDFVASLYFAAQGDDGTKAYAHRTTKTSAPVDRNPTVGRGWPSNLRLYFPSDTTVRASKGGPGCAGTICTSEKWFDNSQFPRDIVRDCISSRGGLLMHNKVGQVNPSQVRRSLNYGLQRH